MKKNLKSLCTSCVNDCIMFANTPYGGVVECPQFKTEKGAKRTEEVSLLQPNNETRHLIA